MYILSFLIIYDKIALLMIGEMYEFIYLNNANYDIYRSIR